MSESLEWHGYDEDTKQKCLGHGSRQATITCRKCLCGLLAENDFGKLLNFVVADGQTLHIVFLLTYGVESVRVLLDITNTNYEMEVDESAALNEEEIICWLTLKRANTSSILTAVMVPHVVAAWLDEEERDAT